MYYRVAIRREIDQLNRPMSWQWQSTVLGSLQSLLQFLRLYGALPRDHLRIFSSSSRENLKEQLAQESNERISHSVTATQFLQERLIRYPAVTQEAPECEVRKYQETTSTVIHGTTGLNENGSATHAPDEGDMSSLERKRLEFELGPGEDHDVAYSFTLSASLPQVLAWMSLLATVHRGELQP